MSFDGFPPEAALDFYDDLEIDNSKFFWEQHKETYRTAVAEPMSALAEELADEFGTAKLFRPHRDVRFSKDKSPYKTHQAPSSRWLRPPATTSRSALPVSASGGPGSTKRPGSSRRVAQGHRP